MALRKTLPVCLAPQEGGRGIFEDTVARELYGERGDAAQPGDACIRCVEVSATPRSTIREVYLHRLDQRRNVARTVLDRSIHSLITASSTRWSRSRNRKDNLIALPPAVVEALRQHVARLEGDQAESDLLFPSDTGGLHTRNVLAKPFAAIAAELGLTINLTPRGMRRTFNDVARAAGMNDVVTMSVSGHVTDKMRIHYSTAQSHEQRAGLSKVHALVSGARPAKKRKRRPKKKRQPAEKRSR